MKSMIKGKLGVSFILKLFLDTIETEWDLFTGIRISKVQMSDLPYLLKIKTSSIDCEYLRREREVLEVLKHKNLSGKGFPSLETFQITCNKNHPQVVTYDIGPSLSELVQGEPKVMNEASIINIGLQIVNRIEKLHDLGYTHGNICP